MTRKEDGLEQLLKTDKGPMVKSGFGFLSGSVLTEELGAGIEINGRDYVNFDRIKKAPKKTSVLLAESIFFLRQVI
jgi:hypothetical protein